MRIAMSEIAGVGTLPAFRREGHGAAIVAELVRDARQRGITTIFLSAENDVIARVYERLGFVRIGTACAADADVSLEPLAG